MSDFRDTLEVSEQASLLTPLEAVIEGVWGCTSRSLWCQLGGCNCVSIEIQL